MNIKVYTSEKVKDKNHLAAINEYDKRLSRYCKITLVDCKDTDSIEKKLNRNSYIIRFSTTGSQISSEEFLEK